MLACTFQSKKWFCHLICWFDQFGNLLIHLVCCSFDLFLNKKIPLASRVSRPTASWRVLTSCQREVWVQSSFFTIRWVPWKGNPNVCLRSESPAWPVGEQVSTQRTLQCTLNAQQRQSLCYAMLTAIPITHYKAWTVQAAHVIPATARRSYTKLAKFISLWAGWL